MIIKEENYLMHYGRKGMKWYQNIFSKDRYNTISKGKLSDYGYDYYNMTTPQLNKIFKDCVNSVDHSSYKHPDIPAGTDIYRVTTSKSDHGNKGRMYVSYCDRDRMFYKGGEGYDWLKSVKDSNGDSRPLRENIYQTTKTLKVASRPEVVEIVANNILKNDKIKKKIGEMYALENDAVIDANIKVKEYIEKHPSNRKKIDKLVERYSKKKNLAERAIVKDIGKNPEIYTMNFISDIGRYEFNSKVIEEELKKRGYDSMVDVFGLGSSTRLKSGVVISADGNDPLIIFNSEDKVKKISSKVITNKDNDEARDKSRDYNFFLTEYLGRTTEYDLTSLIWSNKDDFRYKNQNGIERG